MMVKGIEEEVKMTLPQELQEDITWVQVTKALDKADAVFQYGFKRLDELQEVEIAKLKEQ